MCVCVCVWKSLSHVQLFATPLTVACQASLFMEFSRPEYWMGSLSLLQGNLPIPEIKPGSPALQADSLPTELSRKSNGLKQCLNFYLNIVTDKYYVFFIYIIICIYLLAFYFFFSWVLTFILCWFYIVILSKMLKIYYIVYVYLWQIHFDIWQN